MLLLLLACRGPAAPAPPTASADTTWSEPVTLAETTTVPAGTTLTIDPGVVVSADPGVALIVEGELVARGTEAEPITFTGEGWGGVVFAAGAVDATFQGVDVYAGGSIVEHAVVEGATRGMALAGASPYLHAVTFRGNTIPNTADPIGGAGLLVRDGATPRIRDCRFEDNVAELFAFGGGLYVGESDPIVQDSVFVGNTSSYGGAIATDRMASPIVGSWFEGNTSASDGGAVSLLSTVSALLADTMVDNVAEKDGGGLHVCTTCIPHAAPALYDLVVTGNESTSVDADESAGGIGAAFLHALRSSDVHDNLRDGSPSDFGWFHPVAQGWPEWVASPDVATNWWGTTDADAVAAAVWDGTDDARFGVVTVDPVRESALAAPTPRAVLTTRATHYDVAGDEVPVFLTLYNPGEARTFTLSITRAGAPFQGDLACPAAARDGDGWTLDMPANSVWFEAIQRDTWDGATADDVTWEATLSDADGPVGEVSVARYLLGD